MLLRKIVCFVSLLRLAVSVVNETDLEGIVGTSLSELQDANWTEWLDANPMENSTAPEKATVLPCELEATNRSYLQCCETNDQCDQSKNLVCMEHVCYCRPGYYPNEDNTTCEDRPKKELGQSCTPKDNCYAQFGTCVNGTCVCKDGFHRYEERCKANDYYCPYKRPLMVNGSQWTCNINTAGHRCPNGYWCVVPAEGPRPIYLKIFPIGPGRNLTVEYSYCCPLVKLFTALKDTPDEGRAKVYADVCVHGKPFDTSDETPCPLQTHYWFPGIGEGPVCCPLPCLPHPVAQPVIRNGKCTFEGVSPSPD